MKLLLSLAAVAFVLVAATSAAPQQHNQKQVAPVAVADDLFRNDEGPDPTQSSTEVPTTDEPITVVTTSEEPTETEGSTEPTEEPVTGGSTDTEEPVTGGSTDTEEPVTGGSTDTEEPVTGGSTDTEEPVTSGGGDEGLSDGEIAGIVLGSLAGVALIAGGVFIMHKKKIACFA